jgi:PAS domain S-box-containing protein
MESANRNLVHSIRQDNFQRCWLASLFLVIVGMGAVGYWHFRFSGVVIVVGCLFILLVGAMVALFYRTLGEAKHREAAMELKKSEADLKKAQKVANVGNWAWHIRTNRLEWSEQMFHIFGIDRGSFTGDLSDVISRAIHPDDRAAVEWANLSVIRDKKPAPLEYRILWQDGTVRTVWAEGGELTLDEAGNPAILTGIVQDITDRKRAEDRIHRETSLRNVLLDNMPCIALVLKKQTREIVACNEIAKSFGAVVGKTCHGSIVLQDPPCPFCLAPDLWDTGANQHIEVEYLGKFWQGVWVPFSDDLYVHYVFDVNDRRRAEEEKEKLGAQLQQAMKMEAVGRLAGGVAHDFDNLLTAIIGNVSLASMKVPPSDKVTDLLAEAKKAAERAARLTQQLLAFSRKQIIEPKVLDLNDLIADLESMLARLIGENIGLHTVPGGGLGPVKVDPGQFEQILVNLAVNARDAMPDGGKLLIETANVELDDGYCARNPGAQPGRFVMLAVSDTGHGMSEEVKKHIFEPFFTTKPKGSGTGLGLSMIYGTVLQAGGSIEVDSEEGRGTAFKIHLPRAEGEATRPAKDNMPPDLPGGSETVLLVEDEDVVRDLCVKLLDRLGYRVIQASSGEEAVLLAGNHGERIDLLMTDVVLPGMNGRELADRLVSLHPETKVLFTSGYTDDAIVRHGVLHDDVAFIGKPYSLPVLSKKIRQVLDR